MHLFFSPFTLLRNSTAPREGEAKGKQGVRRKVNLNLDICQPLNLLLNLFMTKIYHQKTVLKSLGSNLLICLAISEGAIRVFRFIRASGASKLLK